MNEWVRALLENDELRQMGHCQRREDGNLGLGWLYYALARIQRCSAAVVIGSFRGFAPLAIAKGLADNTESGEVLFIDPSLWDDFWKSPARVSRHFQDLGIRNIRHFPMTTRQFAETEEYRSLANIGLLFIDGHHTYDAARFDFEAFEPRLAKDGIVLLHDTMSLSPESYDGIAGLHMTEVGFFLDELERRADLQMFDFPRPSTPEIFGTGLTLVRRSPEANASDYRNRRLPGYESLRRGVALFNDHCPAEAAACFREAIRENPDLPSAWLLRGTALVVAGNPEEGFACLEKARTLGHGRAAGLIAELKRELGNHGQTTIAV